MAGRHGLALWATGAWYSGRAQKDRYMIPVRFQDLHPDVQQRLVQWWHWLYGATDPDEPWLAAMYHQWRRDAREKYAWENQKEQCSGPGYAHKPHGACRGYSTDRT